MVRFGMVLGQLAVLKISDWAVKYASFEGNVFMGIFFQYCSAQGRGLEIKEFKTTAFIDVPLYLYHYPIFSSCLYNIHQPEEILFSHIRYVFPLDAVR